MSNKIHRIVKKNILNNFLNKPKPFFKNHFQTVSRLFFSGNGTTPKLHTSIIKQYPEQVQILGKHLILLKKYSYDKAGYVHIDQYMDWLFKHHNYKSLHRQAGNGRAAQRERLILKLIECPNLYENVKPGTFRMIGRSINKPGRHNLIKITDKMTKGRGGYLSALITGVISTGGAFKPVMTIADQVNKSRSTIYNQLKKLSGVIEKRQNLLLTEYHAADKKTVYNYQKQLLKKFKIITSVVEYKSCFYVCYFLPNTYLYTNNYKTGKALNYLVGKVRNKNYTLKETDYNNCNLWNLNVHLHEFIDVPNFNTLLDVN